MNPGRHDQEMADVVLLYAAECSFILSISTLAHAVAITWDNWNFRSYHPTDMVLFTFIALYFGIRRLPNCVGRPFNLLYWKYAMSAWLALSKYYGTLEGMSNKERVGLFLFWVVGLMIARAPRRDDAEAEAAEAAEAEAAEVERMPLIMDFLRNGILIHMWYRVDLNSILDTMIYTLSGVIFVVVFEKYIHLEFMLLSISVVLLAFGFDASVEIAVPFDVVCFSVCYHTVGWADWLKEAFATGNTSHILFSLFIMSSISVISFIFYYFVSRA